MTLRDFFSGGGWLRSRTPEIDDDGLISQEQEEEPVELEEPVVQESGPGHPPSLEDGILPDVQEEPQDNEVVVKAVAPMEKHTGKVSFQFYLNELKHYREQLAYLNRELRQLAAHDIYREKVELLTTIPGIGTLIAMILLLELVLVGVCSCHGRRTRGW